jgi:hypothetical protein
MNKTLHIDNTGFTIEKNKWIENYKKKESRLDAAMKLFLEIKSNMRSEILKKD